MRAVVIHETGDPDVLRLEDVDRPEPGEGEVLIRVHAASINPIDTKYRRGIAEAPLPMILGSDSRGSSRPRARTDSPRATRCSECRKAAPTPSTRRPGRSAGAKANRCELHRSGGDPGGWHDRLAGTAGQGTRERADGARGGRRRRRRTLRGPVRKACGRAGDQHRLDRNREFVSALGADDYVDYTRQEVAGAVSDVDLAFDTVGGETTDPWSGRSATAGCWSRSRGLLPKRLQGRAVSAPRVW